MEQVSHRRPVEITKEACLSLLFGVVFIVVAIPGADILRKEPTILLFALPGIFLVTVSYGLFRLRNWARVGAIAGEIVLTAAILVVAFVSIVGHWVPSIYPTDLRLHDALQHAKPLNVILVSSAVILRQRVTFRRLTSGTVRAAFGLTIERQWGL